MSSPEAIGLTVCDALDHFARRPEEERTSDAFDALVTRLHEQLVAPDPLRGCAGLLWVVRARARFPYQNLAGEVLVRFTPPCPLALDEVVLVVEESFSSSAHKVADYLTRVFGKAALADAVRARRGGWTPEVRARARSFLYCLGEEE